MTLYSLKPRFQAMLRPTVGILADAGVTANQVTIAAALGSVAVGTVVALGARHPAVFLLIPVWLFLRMALNAIDGMLARDHGQKSPLGAFLNEIGDVVSDAALIAPFALVAPFSPLGIGLVIGLAIVSEMTGAMAPTLGASRRYDGPLGKSDRALVFGALGLLIGTFGALPDGAIWIIPALSALLAVTTANRIRGALAEIAPQEASTAAGQAAPALTSLRPVEERTFATHDGTDLFYRWWPALGGPSKGAIVLFHRGHEHSGRMAHLADELGMPGYDIFAWDARGHGRSPGPRGWSPSFGASVRDVQTFIDHIRDEHGFAPADIAVVAQSVGAVLVSTWAHDYAPRIRALVLASPAFKVKLYVPFARQGLALLHKLRGEFFVNSYVKPRLLTHDPARIASYAADPLITRPIAVHILLGLYEASRRVVEDAKAITIPTQLFVSGADWVVHQGPQHRFFERLGSPVKERHVLPGFFHDTFGERDRASVVAAARSFLTARFAEEPSFPSRLDAHLTGHTRDEAEALATPLPALSPRGLYWGATRLSLRLGGALSEGVALGHETGFDSGSTLDYVYRDEARGAGPIGRAIDRAYLDSVGWKGIRRRKVHVEELIRDAVERLRRSARPVHVLDIAAGHGRYVLEAFENLDARPDSILLRDYSDINVAAGAELIRRKGLDAVARFEAGDAFDEESLAAITPAPTLGIVSGLYELFPDNALIRRSLSGLARSVEPGGYLVYTGQPWHPQLELIARALTSHRQGQAWIMRRRTQGEMDELVAAAGFEKVTQRIDEWGVFTVSLARRLA